MIQNIIEENKNDDVILQAIPRDSDEFHPLNSSADILFIKNINTNKTYTTAST